jgi:signal transduction histidine kinase
MKKLVSYLPFVALLILPLLFYPGVNTSNWRSSSDVHAFFEFASSLLALTAGVMVLLHFFSTGRLFFLIISMGFVLISTEEFVHSIFSLNRIWSEIPPTFKLAISSTWLTGRFILSTSFFIALIFGEREIVPAKRELMAVVYIIIGFICTASITLLIFNLPFLPDFVQLGSITKKLIELSLALLFFVAFLLYSNIYLKQQSGSPLLWGIIACIIFQVLAHIFVFDSQAFYDAHWDTAHLIVFLSYFFPIFGVWGETIKLHKFSQVQVIELGKEMTERKRAEEEIYRINTQLEQTVAERTKELHNSQLALLNLVDDLNQSAKNIVLANEALEATNKELESFSYSVSHDLRAPLRSIDGFSQALLEDYQKILDDKGKNYLDKVCKATQHMGNLIDDMLKLSRVTQSEFHPESIDLSKMVQSISDTFQKNNPNNNAKITIQKGIVIQGDHQLMQIALTNLIENAWKFTGKQKHPHIEFGATLKKGENVFFVRDNGVGFDMSYVGKLFGAFQRLHTMDEFAGTGIGLATVQRIIHRHGGKIWAEGEVGKGATFYFTLP